MSGPTRGGTWVARGLAGAAPLLLAGCNLGVLDPRGPIGSADRMILIDSLAIMLVIVVPTLGATLGIAWWYRKSNARAQYRPDWAYSGQLELLVWSIPLLTIMLLGGVAWVSSHELDPAQKLTSDKPTLEIQAVSLDWKWLFIYPDQHIAAVNQLVVPAGAPVHIALTSASVMNAFFVPQLGSMIYTMNGMTTQLNLQADAPGQFMGLSSHYSGDGFSDMHFQMRAVPAVEFGTWVDSTRTSGPMLDAAAYTALAKQSTNVAPSLYRDVDPALFHKIVAQDLPPGPGPRAEQ
jgi:cytochrome o ubiquinol oxidase subunit 2